MSDAAADTPTTRVDWLAGWIVVVGCVALYAATLGFGFTFDDTRTVVRHAGVQGPLRFSAIFLRDSWGAAFDDASGTGWWRPLPTLTYWIDRHVGGGAAWIFHATNLALYAGVLVAMERFLRGWAGDRLGARARWLTVAAFGAMTIHVDVVPSITGRAEILATLCGLIALERATVPRLRARDLVLAAIALLGAAMSKESAITLAALAVVIAARRDGGTDRRGVGAMAATAFVVTAGVLVFRARMGMPFAPRGAGAALINPLVARPLGARWIGAAEVATHYLQHAATGLDLCPDYAYAAIVPATSWSARSIIGFALATGLATWAIVARRRDPRVTDAALGLGATYVVLSHVLFPSSTILADRNFFFASFWVCALVALALSSLTTRGRIGRYVVAAGVPIAIATQALFTSLAARAWRDNATLAAYALQSCPTSTRLRVLAASEADAFDRVHEAAWQILVASAIEYEFPRAIADAEFPIAWDAMPLADRIARLRAEVGSDEDLRRVQAHAIDLAGAEGMPNTALLLTDWPAPLPTPAWLRRRLEAIGKGSLAH